MIKTIFFDIGGVLINIHPNRTFEYLSDCIDIDKGIIKKSFPWDAHNNYEKGLLSDKEWYLAVKDSMPQPCCLKELDFWIGWKLLLGQEKRTLEIIRHLKGRYSIWLLSNTNPRHIQDEIDIRYNFPQLVDGSVYSFDVHYRKPDKNIYNIAMKNAKVNNPGECLFIDDLIENVKAAKNIGMNAIHFKSYEELKNELVSLELIR